MAAQFFYCIQCHKKYPTHQKLFDALYNFSKTAPEACPGCGRHPRPTRQSRLSARRRGQRLQSSLGTPARQTGILARRRGGRSYVLSLPRCPRNQRRQTVLLDAVLACDGKRGALRTTCCLPGEAPVREPDAASRRQRARTSLECRGRPRPPVAQFLGPEANLCAGRAPFRPPRSHRD